MRGASHAYRRLLRGELTPQRYVEIVKRAVDMRMAPRRDSQFARLLVVSTSRRDMRIDTVRPRPRSEPEIVQGRRAIAATPGSSGNADPFSGSDVEQAQGETT